MKKIILAALVVASLFASCSSEKTFKKKDGSTITAKLMAGLVRKTK
nr:MAG TPA: Lysis protein [Caudoviricetes sp.]